MKKEDQNTENEQLRQTPVSGWPLSFRQAYDEMLNGKKICHRYFMDWEWFELYRFNRSKVIAEDGVKITCEQFIQTYETESFLNGWAVFSA